MIQDDADEYQRDPEEPDTVSPEPQEPATESSDSGYPRSLTDVARLVALDRDLGGLVTWLVNIAAVGAILLTVAGAPPWIAAVIWGACLLDSGWQARSTPAWKPARLGARGISRISSVAGSAVLAATLGRLDTLTLVAFALLAVTILTETPLRRLYSYVQQGASGLQKYGADQQTRLPVGGLFMLSLLATAFGVATALTGLTPIPLIVLTALDVVGLIACLAISFQLLATADARRERLTDVLVRYGPTSVLYWRADPGTSYQIEMWLPYLEQLGKPFVVVVRTSENFAEAIALTDRPVLHCRRLPELDDIMVPSVKTVFYVNNAAANTQMVRFPGITHIMLNHGDSDKAPSFNPVSRMYDYNFVAGQAAVDRFAANKVAVPPGQLVIVGRPQVEHITTARARISEIGRPYVLYAPTWAGFTADAQYSSLGVGVDLVKRLIKRGCNVIFRPHPYAYRTPSYVLACRDICAALAADARPGTDHHFGVEAETEMSIVDCFNLSDALISDVSSVASDYLQSEKPLALTVVHVDPDAYVKEFPLARAAYLVTVTDNSLPDVESALDTMLTADPLATLRGELKTYYLGDPGDEPYVNLFLKEARKHV